MTWKIFFSDTFQTLINNEQGKLWSGGQAFLYLPFMCVRQMCCPDVSPALFFLAFLSWSGTKEENFSKNLYLAKAYRKYLWMQRKVKQSIWFAFIYIKTMNLEKDIGMHKDSFS